MFHVPNQYRVRFGRMATDDRALLHGKFAVPLSRDRTRKLVCIAVRNEGWEHVSVHLEVEHETFIPSWNEMCFIKSLFWDAEDVVMQLHPRESEYKNVHPSVLHLWRPMDGEIPTPPRDLV